MFVDTFHVIFRVIHQVYEAKSTKNWRIQVASENENRAPTLLVRAPISKQQEGLELLEKSGPDPPGSGADLAASGYEISAFGGRF
jgi:hypothetical protein